MNNYDYKNLKSQGSQVVANSQLNITPQTTICSLGANKITHIQKTKDYPTTPNPYILLLFAEYCFSLRASLLLPSTV